MSLYGSIAAAQQGRAFENLGRRFCADEGAVAEFVRIVLTPLLAGLRGWVASREGMAAFLRQLSRDDFIELYKCSAGMSDFAARELGLGVLANLTSVHDFDPDVLSRAADASGVRTADVERMLPFIAVLLMAALRFRVEKPVRQVLSELEKNPSLGNAVKDPFAALADVVDNPGQKRDRRQPKGMLRAIFTMRVTPAPADSENRIDHRA